MRPIWTRASRHARVGSAWTERARDLLAIVGVQRRRAVDQPPEFADRHVDEAGALARGVLAGGGDDRVVIDDPRLLRHCIAPAAPGACTFPSRTGCGRGHTDGGNSL